MWSARLRILSPRPRNRARHQKGGIGKTSTCANLTAVLLDDALGVASACDPADNLPQDPQALGPLLMAWT